MQLNLYCTHYTKVNSKWINNLRTIATIKSLEENMKKKNKLAFSNGLLDVTSKAQTTKEKNR